MVEMGRTLKQHLLQVGRPTLQTHRLRCHLLDASEKIDVNQKEMRCLPRSGWALHLGDLKRENLHYKPLESARRSTFPDVVIQKNSNIPCSTVLTTNSLPEDRSN